MRTRIWSLLAWAVLSVSAAGRFVFETSTVGHLDERAVVGAASIAIGVLVGFVYVPSSGRADEGMHLYRSTSAWLVAGCAALSSSGVPLLVFANRYSDAPKGSVVLFWTVVVAGGALWLLGALEHRERPLVAPGALLAVAGAMGVLANWERPSSFSLLSRYTSEQLLMGLGSLAWSLCIFYVVSRVREDGWGRVAVPFSLGAIVSGVALVIISDSPGDALATITLLVAACAALVVFLALTLAGNAGSAVAASALVFAPVLASAITFIESALGARGPRPLLANEVLAASAVCVAGIMIAATYRESRPVPEGDALLQNVPSARLPRVIAALAALCASVAMLAPGVAVEVRGVREVGSFSADFTMHGYETVGGWLVLALALVFLALSRRAARGNVARGTVAFLVGVAAWFPLRFIPLHTWISWIPPEVQQDYGTEYARIVFTPVAAWWQAAALLLCGAGVFILLWDLYGARTTRTVR